MKTGWIVRVEFLDHVQDAGRPIRFVVYGELSRITKTALCIDTWAYADKKQRHDANETRITIVRAAIHKVTRLQEVQE